MRQGIAALQATGTSMGLPSCLPGWLRLTGTGPGRGRVRRAGRGTGDSGHHWGAPGEAIDRLKGDLLSGRQFARTAAPQAEACFHQALAIARRQQAKSWELRAAVSLSRLWQHQGKRPTARELLAPIYGWFTEGFDTETSRRPGHCWIDWHEGYCRCLLRSCDASALVMGEQ